MDAGSQNRMSMAQNQNSSSGRSSEFPRQTTSFDEYQSSEHHKKNQKPNRPTFRSTNREQPNNDFARASIDSINSRPTCSEDGDADDDLDYGTARPLDFKGTGQNGQVLKEDLNAWTRKLHNEAPPD